MTFTAQNFIPFVYIVDSPSSQDIFNGYSIGMALRDTLHAIRVPTFYTFASNRDMFEQAFQAKLQGAINQFQNVPSANAYPFIHLCMHGHNGGIGLTSNEFINWLDLRRILWSHNTIKGYDPLVCMASCNGIGGTSMAHAHDSAFNFLIGNTGAVLQSDVTVAYLAFYNHIFFKNATIDQAVTAMRAASGDNNFYYASGNDIRNKCLQAIVPPPPPPSTGGGWQSSI